MTKNTASAIWRVLAYALLVFYLTSASEMMLMLDDILLVSENHFATIEIGLEQAFFAFFPHLNMQKTC